MNQLLSNEIRGHQPIEDRPKEDHPTEGIRCAVCFEPHDVNSTVSIRNTDFEQCQCQIHLCQSCNNRLNKCPSCRVFKKGYHYQYNGEYNGDIENGDNVVRDIVDVRNIIFERDKRILLIMCQMFLLITGVINVVGFLYFYRSGQEYIDHINDVIAGFTSLVCTNYIVWIRSKILLCIGDRWKPILAVIDSPLMIGNFAYGIMIMGMVDLDNSTKVFIFANNIVSWLLIFGTLIKFLHARAA